MDPRHASTTSTKHRVCTPKDTIPSLVCTGEKSELSSKPLRTTNISYRKQSPEIDAVMKSNMAVTTTADTVNHNDHPLPSSPPSSQIKVSRHIYSPVPHAVHGNVYTEEFPPKEFVSDSRVLISPSHDNKTQSMSGQGMPFPAIKVECCDVDLTASGKISTARCEVTKTSNKTITTGLAGDINNSNDLSKNHQSLLVPSTLIRRRSTDGRLMVGLKDHLVESNLINLSSKTWSRSEGNLPVMSSTSARHPAFLASDIASHSHHLPDLNVHGQNSRQFGTNKTVLEPIRQNLSNSNNNTNSKNDHAGVNQKNADELESSAICNGLDNLKRSTMAQQIDTDLNSCTNQNRNAFPKPRAKSISPRRLNQLDPLPVPGSSSLIASDSKPSQGVRFLSPQPRRKLMPLFRDNLDMQ